MTPQEYIHQVDPFAHQLGHIIKHTDSKAWGLLWEQGTAKTKPVIDSTSILYKNGKINGLIVVAPPGVERNWNTDELPAHLPPDIANETVIFLFETKKKNNKGLKEQFKKVLAWDGLVILLINYSSFMTKEGKNMVWKFLKTRDCMYVLDEAHNIKTPSAKRTWSIVASGKYAKYRRILTGTPMAVGPFDLYSQIRFLDENFWKQRNIGGAAEFRQFFGKWYTAAQAKEETGWDPGYDRLIEYKNLDILSEWLGEISDRLMKDDVLDLPPKLYSKRYTQMSKEQEDIYNKLREEYYYEFENGDFVEADLPIVRLLRLQQVLCGYMPTPDNEEEPLKLIGKKNPRLGTMEDIRDETHTQTLVWARFRHDVQQLMDLLGKDAVRYDGTVDEDDAERAKAAFQAGDIKWFVGTAAKGGPGLTLHQAKTVVYYSNSFKYIDRAQSEDRAHRAGMDKHPVNYIDIICPGTVDERFVENLRAKRDVYSPILGDEIKDWL